MYPFERYLNHLKRKVKNKARIEGSICEAYILEEITNFCSTYFKPHVATNRTRASRNDNGYQESNDGILKVFNASGKPSGKMKKRYLNDEELRAAQLYVLLNCDKDEVEKLEG